MKKDVSLEKWNAKYALAKNYYAKYGNLDIKESYYTKDGTVYDVEGVALGRWLKSQNEQFQRGMLSQEKEEKLKSIGMKFKSASKSQQRTWFDVYELAVNYYNHYGNLEVNIGFKTDDGVNPSEKGYCLGAWVNNQRTIYNLGNMIPKREELLRRIGMRLDVKFSVVPKGEMVRQLREFYDKNGDLDVRYHSSTLHAWIRNLRESYANGTLGEDMIISLEQMGMIWNTFENKERIRQLCVKYEINIDDLKKNMSYQELFSKIAFLSERGISLYASGLLHMIINMNNLYMKIIYGVSCEELISTYYHLSGESKLVRKREK